MKFPIVDPVRTGQNIRTLRKNAGISIKDGPVKIYAQNCLQAPAE